MKNIILLSLFLFLLCLSCGCETEVTTYNSFGPSTNILKQYVPDRIQIIGLSEFVPGKDSRQWPRIKVYVDLLDKYDSRVKFPATFRFELYEFVPRTSRSKGTRIFAWEDFELSDPVENNSHWQDHLRAYKFDLPLEFEPEVGTEFILEATCIMPNGKRLRDIHQIRYQQ